MVTTMSVLAYVVDKLKTGIITFINAVTLANRDYPYEDSVEISFTSAEQHYVVGTNSLNAQGSQRKLFVSKSTLFYATQNCYVRFNHSRNVQNPILRDIWYTFESNISEIFVVRVTTDGTLYAYFEGVLPQEQRSAE